MFEYVVGKKTPRKGWEHLRMFTKGVSGSESRVSVPRIFDPMRSGLGEFFSRFLGWMFWTNLFHSTISGEHHFNHKISAYTLNEMLRAWEDAELFSSNKALKALNTAKVNREEIFGPNAKTTADVLNQYSARRFEHMFSYTLWSPCKRDERMFPRWWHRPNKS